MLRKSLQRYRTYSQRFSKMRYMLAHDNMWHFCILDKLYAPINHYNYSFWQISYEVYIHYEKKLGILKIFHSRGPKTSWNITT